MSHLAEVAAPDRLQDAPQRPSGPAPDPIGEVSRGALRAVC